MALQHSTQGDKGLVFVSAAETGAFLAVMKGSAPRQAQKTLWPTLRFQHVIVRAVQRSRIRMAPLSTHGPSFGVHRVRAPFLSTLLLRCR